MNAESIMGPGVFAPPPKSGETVNVESIAHLLQRYQNLKDAQAWRSVENFKQSFSGLRFVVKEMLGKAAEQNRLHATTFNIFRVLNLEAKADEVHTTFIADLLNPKGAHGQKYLFLHSFLEAMHNSHSTFPLPEESLTDYAWFIEPRKYIGEGTLDIVITCPALNYLVVIANMLYDDEQGDQLVRYIRWMEGNRQQYTWQSLIYLTSSGEAAESTGSAACYPASYHGQVAGMLKSALPQISAPHLRETILQYLEVIQKT